VLEEQVGAGGMAVVFRARDEVLGRLAALKVLAPALAADPEFRARFLRESRAVATVDEPHIIPVYSAGEVGGVLYIATRFVVGGDLASALRLGGALDPGRAAALIAQVGSALDAAHAAGLVHRDVKPANILIDSVPGRLEHAYLSDFGITKDVSGTGTSAMSLTSTGMFLGTPDYCAPEQVQGGTVDGRTDQYALACVAFSLLAGTAPFRRAEPVATLFAHVSDPVPAASALRPGLPAGVDAVLVKALAKAAADRYASCGEFASALLAAVRAPAEPAQPARPAVSAEPAAPVSAPMDSVTVTAGLLPAGLAQAESPADPPPITRSSATVTTDSVHPAMINGNTAAQADAAAGVPDSIAAPARRKRKRKKTIIAGSVALAVLAAAGTATGLVLANGNGYSGPPPAFILSVPNNDSVFNETFSADGRLLAGEGEKNQSDIYLWNVATPQYITTLSVPHAETTAGSLAFGPDGKTLTFADASGAVYRWNLSTFSPSVVRAGGNYNAQSNAALSGDANILAVSNPSGTRITVWNLRASTAIASLSIPGTAGLYNSLSGVNNKGAISLDNNGRLLAASDANGKTYVFNVETRQVVLTLRFDPVSINPAPVISPDGKTIEVPESFSGTGGTLWNIATRSNVTPSDVRWSPNVGSLVFSTDGGVILTQRYSSADLWDTGTLAEIAGANLPSYDVTGVSPGGKELIISSFPGQLLFFNST
jgi:serine/threonine protein kinase/WD40 repeat protein